MLWAAVGCSFTNSIEPKLSTYCPCRVPVVLVPLLLLAWLIVGLSTGCSVARPCSSNGSKSRAVGYC